VGSWIAISSNADNAYRGTWQVASIVDADNFRYTAASAPSSQDGGYITVMSPTWNDQVTDPCYQWLNAQSTTSINFAPAYYNSNTTRANEHYYNYVGAQQSSPNSPFNGTSGVGVGVIGNRPTTCTTGVFYWATDEGAWNSSGRSGQGRGYKCTST